MYFLLSPAKNLDEKTALPFDVSHDVSDPVLINQSMELARVLKTLDVIDIQELMEVSGKIAELNVMRNQAWSYPFDDNKKPAVYLFDGDAYKGLDAYHLNRTEIMYLNDHLGILSGLYGLLKPLDMMLAYRLEMGVKLKTPNSDNLYQFWGDDITDVINARLEQIGTDILINTASQEYFGAVNTHKVNAKIITPKFYDYKNGQYKIISFHAKKARGMMVNFATKHQLTDVNDLKNFDMDGYYFSKADSDDTTWIFKRDELV